jgi:riboflavin kinase / FMN adenylyltransferase
MSTTCGLTLSARNSDDLDPGLPFRLAGIVIDGDHRGRELGYPTANVAMPAETVVPEGVFAGIVERRDGGVHRSAISVGRRETFYGSSGLILVEAFLLDFTDDLYGERLEVTLVNFLRGQEQFGSISDLVNQIEIDVESVRVLIDPAVSLY